MEQENNQGFKKQDLIFYVLAVGMVIVLPLLLRGIIPLDIALAGGRK